MLSTHNFFVVAAVDGAVTEANTNDVIPQIQSITVDEGSVTGSVIGYQYSFKDQSLPVVTNLDPAHQSSNVGLEPTLTISFNETVTFLQDSITLVEKDVTPEISFKIPLAAANPKTGQTFVFETPVTTPLKADTKYWVRIPSGSNTPGSEAGFVDESSNGFVGFQNDTGWEFRTADATPPVFLVADPVNVFDGGFTFKFQLNESGKIYYQVSNTNSPPADHETLVASGIELDVPLGYEDVYITHTGSDPASDYYVFYTAVDEVPNAYTGVLSPLFSSSFAKFAGGGSTNARAYSEDAAYCVDVIQAIPPITFVETNQSDFSNGTSYLQLKLPAGFVFDTGVLPSTTVSPNITNVNVQFQEIDVLRIDYEVNSTAGETDYIQLHGAEARALVDGLSGKICEIGGAHGINFESLSADLPILSSANETIFDIDLTNDPVGLSFSNAQVVALIPSVQLNAANADEDLYTFTISGTGVANDSLYASTAGPGLHDVTLTVTDVNKGCVEEIIKSYDVYDNSTAIVGMTGSYCEDDGAINLTGYFNGVQYTLQALSTVPLDQDQSANLVNPNANGTGFEFDPMDFITGLDQEVLVEFYAPIPK